MLRPSEPYGSQPEKQSMDHRRNRQRRNIWIPATFEPQICTPDAFRSSAVQTMISSRSGQRALSATMWTQVSGVGVRVQGSSCRVRQHSITLLSTLSTSIIHTSTIEQNS